MKAHRSLRPYAFLAFFWLAFAAYVWWSAAQLPERVATHFDANGVPNGWETPTSYIRFTLIIGAAVPAFVCGVFALIRVTDGSLINIPHRDYWLAPERRRETFNFVQTRGALLGGLFIAFFAGVHYFTLVANAHAPVTLPSKFINWVGGGFLAATIAWVASFISHFSHKPI